MEIKIVKADRNEVRAKIGYETPVRYQLTEEEQMNWDTGDTRWFVRKAVEWNDEYVRAVEDMRECLDIPVDEFCAEDESCMRMSLKDMAFAKKMHTRYTVLHEALCSEIDAD